MGLEEDSSDSESPAKPETKPLAGKRLLLMWIPAFCDLTGTTVDPMNFALMWTHLELSS